MSNKVAVFIYESVSGDLSRAYRGLKTALEFVQGGDDVAVVFDGSGVETLAAITDSNSKLNPLLIALQGSVEGACAFCAESHKVTEAIRAAGYTLVTENNGEASVRRFVDAGYTVLNF